MSIIAEMRGLLAKRINNLTQQELLSLIDSLAERESSIASTAAHAATHDGLIHVDVNFQPTADEAAWVATYDPVHHLTWAATKIAEDECNRAASLKAAAECRLLGKAGWQAPSVPELLTILNFENYPACKSGVFKDNLDWTWTRTPYANKDSAGYGRVVDLGDGYVGIVHEDDRYSARAVLAGQQLHLCV